MLHINYLTVVASAVIALVIGGVWYGPLFGKKWMEAIGAANCTEEQKKEAMKGMWKLYVLQFLLVLFQMYVLFWYVGTLSEISTTIHTAFSLWVAFVMPTIAGVAIWSGESKKIAWNKFLIQAGYQLIVFLITGYIMGIWK